MLMLCENCNGLMKHYDKVDRYVKIENGKKLKILVNRNRCCECGKIYRELPDFVMPFKHYRKDIILRCIKTNINCIYDDYPCDMTILRWKKERHC